MFYIYLKECFLALKYFEEGRLTLFSNNLTTLEADDFQGLSNLKILLLNNNILKNFDARAFEPLAQLEKL